MNETPKISQEEIQSLPRWARLAFAARCVRRARVLLQGAKDRLKPIDQAIALVEQAGARGQADERLADAAAAVYTLALNAVDTTEQAPASGPDQDDALIATCTVAHAAAFAAEAATVAMARMASFLTAQSVEFAIQAHIVACPDAVAEVVAAMREDLELLQEAVAREGWGNLHPVSSHFFPPL